MDNDKDLVRLIDSIRFDLPTRVDDSGGQGEASHGRHGDGYSDIRRRSSRPKSSAAAAKDAAVPPAAAAGGSTACPDKDDPSSPTITAGENEHQGESDQYE